MGADAGGSRVVCSAHLAKARKRSGDSCLVSLALESREPQAHGDQSEVTFAELDVCQGGVDERSQGGLSRCEIDMDIRRSPGRLRDQLSVRVAQSSPGTGGAAVDAQVEGAAHTAATEFDARINAAAATRSASAALAGVSRFALAPGGVCLGVTGKCRKTAGIAVPRLPRCWSAPK